MACDGSAYRSSNDLGRAAISASCGRAGTLPGSADGRRGLLTVRRIRNLPPPGSQLGVNAIRVVFGQHRRRPDEELVRLPDGRLVLALVVELPEHVLDRFEPGPLLVVALDQRPGRLV